MPYQIHTCTLTAFIADHTSIQAVTDMYVGFRLLPSELCLAAIITVGSLS